MIGFGTVIERFFIIGHEVRIALLTSEIRGTISIKTMNISPNEAFIMHQTLYANKITFCVFSLSFVSYITLHRLSKIVNDLLI